LSVLPVAYDSVDELGSVVAASGLRERKKHLKRTAIADQALELFARHGFDETTVSEVAAQAGVSPATVARYFPTKESMLFAQRDERVAALRAAILDRPAREAPLRAVIEAIAAQPAMDESSHVRLLQARQAIARSSVLRGRAYSLLDEWRRGIADALVERGRITAADARTLAAVVVAVLDDVAERWADEGGRGDIQADTRRALSTLDRTTTTRGTNP
jgi:AcrR family transcriptional regulator